MYYFFITQIGRIVNRFSSDIVSKSLHAFMYMYPHVHGQRRCLL